MGLDIGFNLKIFQANLSENAFRIDSKGNISTPTNTFSDYSKSKKGKKIFFYPLFIFDNKDLITWTKEVLMFESTCQTMVFLILMILEQLFQLLKLVMTAANL